MWWYDYGGGGGGGGGGGSSSGSGSRGKGNTAIVNFALLVEVASHFLNFWL
jgi:hypothetical protein